MRQKVRPYTNPNESAFLGLFEGRKKTREAEAKIKILEAQAKIAREEEEARRQASLLQLEMAKQGFEPEKDKAIAAIAATKAAAAPEQSLYIMLGIVVTVVMISIVLIKRKK